MAKKGTLVLFAVCCILLSVPVSYLVNTYRMANAIPPSDGLTLFAKFLPLIAVSILIAFGTRDVVRLANTSKTREATRLIALLTLLLITAIAVELLTFNLGVRYVL